jgi:uncharacterized protein with von Willebrand factor type A (vWA) domain
LAGLTVALLCAAVAWAAPSAELSTYDRAGGPTYYSLSLTPDADSAEYRPCDVVVLFDTSASQTGAYRETALAALDSCLAELGPQDRVQLLAVDLDARPLTDQFVPAQGPEIQAAVESLHRESPLGSTDMDRALAAAAARFDSADTSARAVLYIGDGISMANLLGTESFGRLVEKLRAARIPVSSYAIGPQRDARLLASLANQTGGNLYIAEPMSTADDAANVSSERAKQENVRLGAKVGEMMAEWTHAEVLWPAASTWPQELGNVYPAPTPPLRSDRDTIVIGETDRALDAPLAIELRTTDAAGEAVEVRWTVRPSASNEGNSYLTQLVDVARADGGITLPTVGTPGLLESGRLINAGIDNLTNLAERAVAMGDVHSAQLMSDAVLRRDPGNVKAHTVQRVVNKSTAGGTAAVGVAASGEDLNLVRPAQANGPAGAAADSDRGFPAEGSLTDRFAGEGALLDDVEQQKHLFSEMLRKEVENTVIDARRQMRDSPEQAAQQLKLTLQNVERATELNPATRAQLVDKLQTALRESQRAASIKDELDAEREESLAAARERQMLNARLARQQEKEKQLVERFMSLVDEKRFGEAEELAVILEETDPEGVVPRVADVWGRLQREYYLQEVARLARWKGFSDTLYQIDLSAVPFPDEPPIVYPEASVWEELSVRRKKSSSVDLKKKGSADEKIEEALASPLVGTGLQFTDVPLEQVVASLRDQYDMEVQIDTPALDDIGLSPDELVTVDLRNVTLRSALRFMLSQLQLTYVIRDEVLMITTPEEAETELIVKVYPVADLVLPIELPQIGGGMGGLGGGGGGQGGGGGGLFSVPDDASKAVQPAVPAAEKASHQTSATKSQKTLAASTMIELDPSVDPEVFWDRYFRGPQCNPAAVRQTVRELMGKHQVDQVVVLIQSALRNGQPQSWMYESLGIAMELSGKSKPEIERAVMSAADFSTSADELMYIARYLSRLGLDQRAFQLYQQVIKLEPLRYEAYVLGLQAAERCDDLAGIQWATVGILGQAWPKGQESIQDTANNIAQATLERLTKEGRQTERDAFLAQLREASIRDCVVRVSWTGEADVDVSVEDPTGSICSFSDPRTAGGGVWLGDAFSREGRSYADGMSEVYVCPRGFVGTYRVRIHRVWGEVTAGKVTVDVYTHLHGEEAQHERRQLDLNDKDALAIFELNAGRRAEPLEASQLATAVERQQAVSRTALAQQLDSLSDEGVIPGRADAVRFRRELLGRGGAVGYQPIIQTLSEGRSLIITGVVSADRRYVRISPAPSFTQIGDVQSFTFAGVADQEEADGGAAAP